MLKFGGFPPFYINFSCCGDCGLQRAPASPSCLCFWAGVDESAWVVYVCFLSMFWSPGLDSGRGHLGATEGSFAQRSAGWQTSSPFNLFNTGLSVKIPTNRVFVLFLSKMALLLIIPLHLQDSQAIHRIPQQLTCRSHTPASGASSPA